jgi:hypothetical protein
MRKRYYSAIGGEPNTCNIRSLKRAFIGNGVRMSSDKNTISFENVPMKGTLIESYNEQGFRISHSALPKAVWVNFEQLPLTRLQIDNGVISDEITFVENIVSHQMQLIRTLDTEFIDMIYKEKVLDEKKDEIIPISAAIPGQIYIGAQCEEGTEMIFLGTFFIKSLRVKTSYSSSPWNNRRDETKYYFEKLSPMRAFFAVLGDEVSKTEEENFVKQFFGSEEAKWKLDYQERNRIDKLIFEAKKKYLAEQKIPRFKILEFAVTSKRIKDVILTNQENSLFSSKEQNKEYLLAFLEGQIPEYSRYTICNRYGIDDIFFINDDKNTVEEKGRAFAKEKKNIVIDPKYWEDRFKKD